MTWLIVGSSPSVETYLEAALGHDPDCTTMTCNAGILLVPAPHVYWVSDVIAVTKFRDHALRAAMEGTRIVSHSWALPNLNKAGIPCAELAPASREEEIVLALTTLAAHRKDVKWPSNSTLRMSPHESRPFQLGSYVNVQFSGLYCVQWALNHGANRIVLVGMDGYASDLGGWCVETFDGQAGIDGVTRTEALIRPFLQSCVDATPHVEWIQYGVPTYKVAGMRVVERI